MTISCLIFKFTAGCNIEIRIQNIPEIFYLETDSKKNI